MGTYVGNQNFQNNLQQGLQYGQTTNNIPLFNAPIQPNFQSAYNANIIKANSNPGLAQPTQSVVQEESSSGFLDSLPVIGSAVQILGGISSLFEGNKLRKQQENYEAGYKADMKNRREMSRKNDFYLTPYTVGRTDSLTAKKGLKVPMPFYQNGGQMDLFMDFYNQQEMSKKRTEAYLTDTYEDKNELMKQKASSTKSGGIGDILGGAVGLASGLFQEGGDVEGIPESEDLYSDKFVSPYEIKEQVENELKTESPGEEMQGNSNLMSWLFEESPLETYTVSDIYDAKYSKPVSYNSDIPTGGSIAVSHSNPGNIKYGQFAQKYGASPGRAAKDGGIFAVFPTVEAGLQAQKDLLLSKNYANLTVADAMKRWSNSGYGADLYPEVANKKMKDLTSQELTTLVRKQIQREDGNMYKKLFK